MTEITTKDTIKVQIDKTNDIENETRFTATVIAETMHPLIQNGDSVIVERDYVNFINDNQGYVQSHGIYAITRREKIVPLSGHVYISADKDKNAVIEANGVSVEYPEHFRAFQTEITTHDGIVLASASEYFNEGDQVYCHHHLTHESNRRVICGNTVYQLPISQVYCTVKEGDIQMYNGWNLLEAVEAENDYKLQTHVLKEAVSGRYARLVHKDINAVSLSEGEKYMFTPNSDYEMIVEGKKYFRIKTQNLVACVVEETK